MRHSRTPAWPPGCPKLAPSSAMQMPQPPAIATQPPMQNPRIRARAGSVQAISRRLAARPILSCSSLLSVYDHTAPTVIYLRQKQPPGRRRPPARSPEPPGPARSGPRIRAMASPMSSDTALRQAGQSAFTLTENVRSTFYLVMARRVRATCRGTCWKRWPGQAGHDDERSSGARFRQGENAPVERHPADRTVHPGQHRPGAKQDVHRVSPSGPGIGTIRSGSISIQTGRPIACISVGGVLTRSRRSESAGRTTYSQYSPR